MPTAITMPVLGLTMEEGTVARWLKAVGETVAREEPLLEVEMDKGTVEVPSPSAGVLGRILVQEGQTVPIRTPIAELLAPGEALSAAPPAAATTTGVDASAVPNPAPAGGPADLPPVQQLAAAAAAVIPTGIGRVAAAAPTAAAPDVRAGGRVFSSPRARLRARERGLEVAGITGSGPNGRVVEADVLRATATTGAALPVADDSAAAGQNGQVRTLATPLARRLALEHGLLLSEVAGTGPGGRITHEDVLGAAEGRFQAALTGDTSVQPPQPVPAAGVADVGAVQPLSRIRRITARRMAESARSVARVTLFAEADLTEAAHLRRQLQPEYARLGVAKLPWDAILARAAGLALQTFPELRGEWVEPGTDAGGQPGVRVHADTDVGIAVALGEDGRDGLVVPVLRDCAGRSIRALAADLLGLVDQARAGRLGPAAYEGGVFAITNLGQYGLDGFTPVVIPGQAAILGVGRIAPKAVVDAQSGAIVARTGCTLSLAFDHRIVDGAPAAAFLHYLVDLLQRPYALLDL